MTIFYITLCASFFLAVFARIICRSDKNLQWLFGFLCIAIIFILVSGLRNNITDTATYMKSYSELGKFSGLNKDMKDKGFIIFQLILYKVNQNPQFLVFITSFITQFCVIHTIYKYRSYLELNIYMYITSGIFLVTMNGIRQSMVGAILFFFTKLIIDKKFIPYFIITLILSTMHASALIMIPLYFVANQKPWSKSTMIIIVISSVSFILFYKIVPYMFDALQNTSYSEYEEFIVQSGTGASFTRVLVNSVPVVLAYMYRNELSEKWPQSNVFINLSLINLIFITFALYNWIFARFQIYFQFYNIILLPYIVKNCIQEKSDRNLIYYLFLLLYFGFFYYEQVIGFNGVGYESNYFNI